MADSSVPITAGSGTNIDTRTESINGDHRQVVVLGDPVTGANVAQVSAAGALYVQGYQGAINTLNVTTSSSTTGAISAANYNIAMVSIHGTHAGINLTWEISDDGGTTWYAVQAQRDDTGAVSTTSGVVTSNASWSWTIPVGAATHIRVRSTAYTSGTGIVGVSLQSMPYEPIPSVYVQGTAPANVSQINGVTPLMGNGVTGTGSLRVTIASDNSAVPYNQTQVNGVTRLVGNGIAGAGTPRVTIASDNTAFTVNTTPTTPTQSFINSAATTNATSVKASAGTVFNIVATNTNAAARYLKFYNKASAPTVGTDVPVLTITLPASQSVTISPHQGIRFGSGIALATTTGAADSDTGAVAANEIKIATSYI